MRAASAMGVQGEIIKGQQEWKRGNEEMGRSDVIKWVAIMYSCVNKEHVQDGISYTVGPAVNTAMALFSSEHKDPYDA